MYTPVYVCVLLLTHTYMPSIIAIVVHPGVPQMSPVLPATPEHHHTMGIQSRRHMAIPSRGLVGGFGAVPRLVVGVVDIGVAETVLVTHPHLHTAHPHKGVETAVEV